MGLRQSLSSVQRTEITKPVLSARRTGTKRGRGRILNFYGTNRHVMSKETLPNLKEDNCLWSHYNVISTGSLAQWVRVFANDPGDLGSIPGRVIPKTLKMVLDTSLLNTRQYKVRIESKVEQSR